VFGFVAFSKESVLVLEESVFNALASSTLAAVEQALERCDVDCDAQWKGDGVLEIAFDYGARMVLNRHGVAQELWLADRSGGFHYRYDGSRWLDTRDGSDLFSVLSRLVSQHTGQAVILAPG